MRNSLRTNYLSDSSLFPKGGRRIAFAACGLLLVCAPLIFGPYVISQLTFVYINWIVALGLMLLIGYAGQVALGHAAFFAVGAYGGGFLEAQGLPFLAAFVASGVLAGAIGVVVGLPALRMRGIYLVMATLSFAIIVEEVLLRWNSVTGGARGFFLPDPTILGRSVGSTDSIYYIALITAISVLLIVVNILRSRTGRALMAIRDSDVAAETIGIRLAYFKTLAFVISAATAGVAGFISAHKLSYISPEQFEIGLSIEFLTMVIVGGLGTVLGALLGAIFVVVLPQLITMFAPLLPDQIGNIAVLNVASFAIILILFVLFEPRGLYGYWSRLSAWLREFPLHRRGAFERQKIGSDLVSH